MRRRWAVLAARDLAKAGVLNGGFMSYVLEAWAAAGPDGEALIANKVISSVDIHRVTEEWRKDPN